MSGRCYFVNASAAAAIGDLRQQEYSKAEGFRLDLSTLQWKESDNQSFVMVAEENGTIVSTMRGEVITDLRILEAKLECPWDFPQALEFPVLLLSRAATSASHRGEGLNLVLRYWFLQMAKSQGLRFVLGTFVAGSPREKTLKEMGYAFFENRLGWQQSSYRSLAPVQVVSLDMGSGGAKAMEYAIGKVGDSIERFPFVGDFGAVKTVTDI